MPGQVSANLRRLQEHVGTGKIGARVIVDQVYAHFQHESLDLRHDDGAAKFLEGPLFENHATYYQKVADSILDTARPLVGVFRGVGADLRDASRKRTPKLVGDLALSGAVEVVENGATVARIPSARERLSEEQIRAKQDLFDLDRGDW